MDDDQLVDRMRHGDESAFSALFERHKAAIHRYAIHMSRRDGAAADDIVQEVFLAFLRQLGQYDAARGSVRGYLVGIARRQILRQMGRTRFDDPLDADAPIASAERNPFEHVSQAEAVERVRAAIGRLPPAFREAVVLCDLNEMDYATAAGVAGCPVGTIRSRLHRARALLETALSGIRSEPVTSHG